MSMYSMRTAAAPGGRSNSRVTVFLMAFNSKNAPKRGLHFANLVLGTPPGVPHAAHDAGGPHEVQGAQGCARESMIWKRP